MAEKKLTPPQWLGRPILHEEHVQDLETRSAINEFHHKMPRAQAEQRAHEDYVKEQRERAAAHHLAGMKAAMATGNHEDARKHWALYDLHLKALGKESIGAVPPEIEKRMMEDGGSKPVYKFKAHKGDLYALHEPSKDQAPAQGEPIQKAEARQCKWRLGERRCQRMVTTGYCHDHVDHWANKIKQKEAASEPELAKQDMPPAGTGHLAGPPQLHGSVEGFMAGLKAIPKGDPARGKYITQHMNHGPFLQALQQHPQGKQIHQFLTQHLNSTANAGFKPGAAKAVVKAEAQELASQPVGEHKAPANHGHTWASISEHVGHVLGGECGARALDDDEDFEATRDALARHFKVHPDVIHEELRNHTSRAMDSDEDLGHVTIEMSRHLRNHFGLQKPKQPKK